MLFGVKTPRPHGWLTLLHQINKKDTNHIVGLHYSDDHHNGLDDTKIHIVDFIHAHPQSDKAKSLRDKIEQNWIHTLKTVVPLGLNTMD